MALSAALLRNLVPKVVKVFGDIMVLVTYVNVVPGNYDPATGATTDATTSVGPFYAPVVRGDEKEMASFPAPDRMRLVIVPYAQIRGLTPSHSDYFLVATVRWEVKRIKTVPSDAITKFYCEAP